MLSREPELFDEGEGEQRWRTEVAADGTVLIFKKGRLRFPNGDEYVGEFVNNKRHGKGEFRRSTGDHYNGAPSTTTTGCHESRK